MSRLILVLGCHRSGTSAVASAVRSLGVEFGDRAQWSGPDNPDFVEDRDILTIDEAVLKSAGSRWDRILPPDLSRVPQGLVNTARFELRRKLERWPLFGLKEPRLCRLLPFWRPILAELACEVSVVHVVRNPLSVADSLMKRNDIGPERALYLWLFHVVEAIYGVDPAWPLAVVDYDRFIEKPWFQIGRLSGALDLDIPDGVTFPIEPAYRHHTHSRKDAATSPLCSQAVAKAFAFLSDLAQDKPVPLIGEVFAAIRRELEKQAHVFRAMDGAESGNAVKQALVKGAHATFRWRGPGDAA